MEALMQRANSACELCQSTTGLTAFSVSHAPQGMPDQILLCDQCHGQMSDNQLETHHWHCLTTSMWSEVPAVKEARDGRW